MNMIQFFFFFTLIILVKKYNKKLAFVYLKINSMWFDFSFKLLITFVLFSLILSTSLLSFDVYPAGEDYNLLKCI